MSQNGKGSAPRQQTAEERKRYADNYDRIFRKRKPVKPVKKDSP